MAADTNRLRWPASGDTPGGPARCPRKALTIAIRIVACVLLATPLHAAATEVYRWVDGDGVVQFGQRPPPGGAERVDIRPPAPAGSSLTDDRRERQQRLLDSYAHERERKREEAAAGEQARLQRAGQCAEMRRHLDFLDHGGPVYYETDDGGRDYLSEARRQTERRRILTAGARDCAGISGW
jgi:hypothetical protein